MNYTEWYITSINELIIKKLRDKKERYVKSQEYENAADWRDVERTFEKFIEDNKTIIDFINDDKSDVRGHNAKIKEEFNELIKPIMREYKLLNIKMKYE